MEMVLLAEVLSELVLSIDAATLLLAIRVTAVLGPSIHSSQEKIDSKEKSQNEAAGNTKIKRVIRKFD